MLQVLSIPNAGRLPLLENLPDALQLPVARLGQLKCVDYVAADVVLDNTALVVMILFTGVPDYRRALQCFRGLRASRVEIIGKRKSIVITIAAYAQA